MKVMSYSESRARYAELLASVSDDREEVVITRDGHDPVVFVSLADSESLKETAYLLRSPANTRRLLASIEELEDGGTVRKLTTEERRTGDDSVRRPEESAATRPGPG
ncbi:type II toxin-antitoxin system prevent-host-death family antitoxin [Streptomyces sp. ICBB 8177]|uniref:type II toxin-antitoxin system Phd/YefM family antitoxin n=1 Tax=Streptomyces sp. ICBB 8177 TaxID=563922 RepID=UPI000D67510E|nr:type II toxin-antitoxin system prevent-host-death family antitoxin [Streptomyces sp. ICBB 8177]PWI43320.1 type II toxin-antitoxin system prevent-host-death family antitoxin [Streptomyces sp. ICBB 8177]